MISEKVSLPSGGNQPSTRKGEKHEAVFTVPHTVSATVVRPSEKLVNRVVRIPLVRVSNEQWMELRKLAFICTHFGNHLLTNRYAYARGLRYPPPAEGEKKKSPYRDYGSLLSAPVRDSINIECDAVWTNLGTEILRGAQTLARFSVGRALTIRDRGITVGDTEIILKLHPGRNEGTILPIYMKGVAKDWFLSDLLNKFRSQQYKVVKGTLCFKRPGRDIELLLTYQKPVMTLAHGNRRAFLRVNQYDELWLDCEGRHLSLTHWIAKLRHMKKHFANIHARLRRSLKRHARHQALTKCGGYEDWAHGVIHQLTAEIIGWCQKQGCRDIYVAFPKKRQDEEDIAWAGIAEMLKYKCEDNGMPIEVEYFLPNNPKSKELQELAELADEAAKTAARMA
jgi:hypothetical protein